MIVAGASPLLQTDRADVNTHIDSKQSETLPTGTRSNFQTLERLIPGVSNAVSVHSSFYNSQYSLNTEANGVSGMGNSLQIEGIDDNEMTNELNVYIPPPAAIQTANVTTSNYAPEFGRATGAVVNLMLKSDTNQFHGSAYEFNQISALAARSYFNHSSAFPRSTYNYYGATLGGPIVKNNTFSSEIS